METMENYGDTILYQKVEDIDSPNSTVQGAEYKLEPLYHYRRVKFGFRTLYIPLSQKVPKCNLPYHNWNLSPFLQNTYKKFNDTLIFQLSWFVIVTCSGKTHSGTLRNKFIIKLRLHFGELKMSTFWWFKVFLKIRLLNSFIWRDFCPVLK